MVSAPRAPSPPDPVATSQAQTASNIGTATANAFLQNPNQVTPYGNLTYEQTGTHTVSDGTKDYQVPSFTATTTLTPEQQQMLNSQNQATQGAYNVGNTLLGRVSENLATPMDYSGLPSLTQDYSADRRRVEDAFMQRANEDYTRNRAQLDQTLANKGIASGTQAYNNAQQPMDRAYNDMLSQAIIAGGQEQSRLANLGMQTRQQGIQEQAFQREQPINELSGLFGLGPGVQNPTFAPVGNSAIQGTDVAGNYYNSYNAAMQGYNSQLASRNAMLGGVGSILGTGIGAAFRYSDRRLKKDIRRVGEFNDLPLYQYHYKWQDKAEPLHVGVMAQDVERTNPEAVTSIFGMKAVDYNELIGGNDA